MFKSRQKRCSIKKDVLENFALFTEKHLCWNLFLIKLQTWWSESVFLWILQNFKNTYFEEHLRTAASRSYIKSHVNTETFRSIDSNQLCEFISWKIYVEILIMNYFTLGNFNFQKYIHGKELNNFQKYDRESNKFYFSCFCGITEWVTITFAFAFESNKPHSQKKVRLTRHVL